MSNANRSIENAPGSTAAVGIEDPVILLVDDHAQVRMLTEMILQDVGHTVVTAMDAEEALGLAALHREKLRLVVSDVLLPGIDGIELRERLRWALPGVPVLLLSGAVQYGTSGDRLGFLQKPYNPEEFLRLVALNLASRSEAN